jgi:hypothetical protein
VMNKRVVSFARRAEGGASFSTLMHCEGVG